MTCDHREVRVIGNPDPVPPRKENGLFPALTMDARCVECDASIKVEYELSGVMG